MSQLFVDFTNGKVERQYRGARTVRFVSHMRPESLARLRRELEALTTAGYTPTRWGNGWLYSKGANAA